MALNNCGPISIGGCTTGQSIAKELGLTTTATHSLNCSSYRTLSGQPSGAVSMNAFHGKSNASYLCITTSGACVSVVCGSYKVARFSGSGSFTVNSLGSGVGNCGNRINYLAVAGGGHGAGQDGCRFGGGGAGGVLNCCNALSSSGFTVSTGTYTVSIGAGSTNLSLNGNNTTVSKGGAVICTSGGGHAYQSSSGNGGSGGGGRICGSGAGSGISGQGNSGGNGTYYSNCCGYFARSGGGGGGASAAGGSGLCGYGGAGRSLSFIGGIYGGGGGGGWRSYYTNGTNAGGSGGGGTGGVQWYPGPSNRTAGQCGSANTGGGGGGSGCSCGSATYGPGNGGSGFFAIKWRYKA